MGGFQGLLDAAPPPRICPSPIRPGPRFLPPSSLFSLLPILLAPHVQGPLIWLSGCRRGGDLLLLTRDKEIQNENEKEPIRLASAKGGAILCLLCLCGEY